MLRNHAYTALHIGVQEVTVKKIISILCLILALSVVSQQSALAGPELQQGGKAYYVAWGDSLDSIAARHGVTVEAILRQNGLSNPDLIYVGQLLIIPTSGYDWMPEHDYGDSCATYHIVSSGETLSGIAWAYDTTVYTLLEHNNLYNKDIVYVGQKLCIPGSGYHNPTPDYPQHDNNDWGYNQPQQPQSYYHTVAPGETLSAIAFLYGTNQWSIVEANHMNNASYIWVGQALIVPVSNVAKPGYGYDGPKHGGYTPAPPKKDHYYVPDPPKRDHDDDKKSNAPDVYVRLGRNVNYEEWGRPQLGLDDCSNWFDDAQIVRRLTAEVIVTNKSSRELSGDWASAGNVVIHTAAGATRYACKHLYSADSPASTGQGQTLVSQSQDVYPRPLAPGGTISVTFYTHLEKGDFATKIEFKKLGACFDPNSGDRILCNH